MPDDLSALVVDGDAASAKLMTLVLGDAGWEVRAVPSAEEALRALETFHPAVIVLDLVLPLMSGVLLAQQLKADPATRHVVIVAVAGFNGAAAERVAREAGCAAYVRKPIDAFTFPQQLLAHLGARHALD